MKNHNAVVLGATGLIGNYLTEFLKEDDYFQKVTIISRRALDIDHKKIKVKIIDFKSPNQFRDAIGEAAHIFCCIGTTMQKVQGDKELYREIDFDIPVHAAQYGAGLSCRYYAIVSSVGANANSRNFYLSLKGEVEEAIKVIDIPRISIFQPSMLLGQREEFRLGERVGKLLMQPLSSLIPAKYRPIQAREVAQAMLRDAKNLKAGTNTYQYQAIKSIVSAN